jgi:hypothetical protein
MPLIVLIEVRASSINIKGGLAQMSVNLVPHSQCSLRENPKFLQKFRYKNNTLKEKF